MSHRILYSQRIWFTGNFFVVPFGKLRKSGVLQHIPAEFQDVETADKEGK
jgi:hypothetical protein